ncbi:MAG: UDPGP type 1 family protein, partial [Planctomycetota bacterium]
GEDSPAAKARRATPPSAFVGRHDPRRSEASSVGKGLLAEGKVGAILVAGGQGTRLGFDKPKGMYPIGPISEKTLFQILCEQLLQRAQTAGVAVPYYVMTSDATHDATVAFFEEHAFFRLPPEDVFFFRQGNMPAVDAATGEVLLAAKDAVAKSPDGHGGLLAGLKASGALADMAARGVEVLHYHQVDNPTAIVCDPVVLGFHRMHGSEMTTKVVPKVSPTEKMGLVCEVDGSTQIVEYSDLPDDVAEKRADDGELFLRWGNTAIHVFERAFLDRLADDADALPFHVAHKKVGHLASDGGVVTPDAPNAYKFERFIFDALPAAEVALVVETNRAREFNPVKNASGADSPATSRQALIDLHTYWMRQAGAEIADGIKVEISPLFAVDSEQVARKITPGTRYVDDLYLTSRTAAH